MKVKMDFKTKSQDNHGAVPKYVWLGLFVLIVVIPVYAMLNPVHAYTIISKGEDDWTCYDHAMDYKSKNPDWNILLISGNSRFLGWSHFANYKIEGKTLYIHDGFYDADYSGQGWQYCTEWMIGCQEYYYFYDTDDIVTQRFFVPLLPNVEDYYDQNN